MEWDIDRLAADVRAAVETVRPLPSNTAVTAWEWDDGAADGWTDPIYLSVSAVDGNGYTVEGFYDAVCDMAAGTYAEQVEFLAEQVLLG
jgi:hypothetical protein